MFFAERTLCGQGRVKVIAGALSRKLLVAFWGPFGGALASFGRSFARLCPHLFLGTLFGGLLVPTPPSRASAAWEQHLWRGGNIAFGPLHSEIPMRF